MGGLSAPPPGNQAIRWPESKPPEGDHDAHVKAYRRRELRRAVFEAYYTLALHRMAMGRAAVPRKKRKGWTWKNHLANWINKTLNLLEKWGL